MGLCFSAPSLRQYRGWDKPPPPPEGSLFRSQCTGAWMVIGHLDAETRTSSLRGIAGRPSQTSVVDTL